MKRSTWTYVAMVAAAPAAFAAQTPAEAIAAGRAAIEAKQFDRAIITMQDAIPAATMIADAKQKAAALAAIHFYSALAFSELERDDKAREELREFFRFQPGADKLDEARYPVPFVRAFNEVAAAVKRGRTGPQLNSFDAAYPGFNEFALTKPRERKLSAFDESTAFVLLATDAERHEWRGLHTDDERAAFISKFWQRRGEEFHQSFERRVAFADDNFSGNEVRGSLTDRGRVFVLVGTPYRVTMQPLDASRVLANRIGDYRNRQGSMERWTFDREQLPVPLPVQSVTFTFIDEPGYGDHILQRDAYTIKELDAVRKKHSGTEQQ